MNIRRGTRFPCSMSPLFLMIVAIASFAGALLNQSIQKTRAPPRLAVTEEVATADEIERKVIRTSKDYELLQILPHDKNAFTQGLTFDNGKLLEGTGNYGQSELRHVDPVTGNVLDSYKLPENLFGEGIAFFTNDKGQKQVIQLTWRESKGFIYSAEAPFTIIKEFEFETHTKEGWGITYWEERKEFIVSDGSNYLFFWDRDTLKEKRRIPITVGPPVAPQGRKPLPVSRMNELEFQNGSIIANIWYQNVLLRIDPEKGEVTKIYDFTDLYTDRDPKADCFNGIAVTERDDEFYVTGKWWPHMYRVKLL